MTLTAAAYHQLSPLASSPDDNDLEIADALDSKTAKKSLRKVRIPVDKNNKRAVHNKIERARRETLNGRFQVSLLSLDQFAFDRRVCRRNRYSVISYR